MIFIRESEPFEKIIEELTKRLIAKKGKADARAMFPIDSTTITLTSKLLWEKGWHQVKLFSGLNSITTTVEGIVSHFGQDHDSLIRRENGRSNPRKWSGGNESRVCFSSENYQIIRRKDQHFILRVKNNMTLEMLKNGGCKLGKGKRQVEVRVAAFCDLESQTEFRIATDLPLEGKGAVSNEEIGEMYRQRWQI
ncbi:MAG UNVERIFIED_CONTAM: hypothetical protein LVR29_29975 [Microcystis novacekii LVE1205-3]